MKVTQTQGVFLKGLEAKYLSYYPSNHSDVAVEIDVIEYHGIKINYKLCEYGNKWTIVTIISYSLMQGTFLK